MTLFQSKYIQEDSQLYMKVCLVEENVYVVCGDGCLEVMKQRDYESVNIG